MIEKAQRDHRFLTWTLSLVGFILVFMGPIMVHKPFSAILDVLPILGDIFGASTGIILFLLIGFQLLITIAAAWIFYCPLLEFGLLAAAVVFTVLIKGRLATCAAAA